MLRQASCRLTGLTRLTRRQFCSSLQPEEKFPAKFEVKLNNEKYAVSESDIEAMFDYSLENVEKLSDHWDDAMEIIRKSEEVFPPHKPTESELASIRASRPTCTLASLVNHSETLQRLVDLGVELHHWDRLGHLGLAAKLDFNRDVAPTVQFLADLGLQSSAIANILTHAPVILEEREEDLKARIAYLASKNFSKSEILQILSKSRAWLIFSVRGIDARLGFFQKTFDLLGSEVRQLTVSKPTLITWSGVPGTIKKNLFSYNEEMGFTKEELKEMSLSCPKILMSSVDQRVLPQFEILHNEAKISHSTLAKFPATLLAPWIETRSRLKFLQSLGRDQFDPVLPNYVSPELLTDLSDQTFCERAARCNLVLYEDFQRTL